MPKSVIIESPGGPEVLQIKSFDLSDPAPQEVQIEHTAIEVNYIDIYHRKGLYTIDSDPKTPGVSAIGRIVKVGAEVKELSVGDRVGYVTASGAYSEVRNINSRCVIPIPEEFDDKILASCLLKGLTAHMLVCQVYVVRPATAVLIHAAAGGVGRLLAQWCRDLGAYVIGTVGSQAKKEIALQYGCHMAINYKEEDWVAKVREITGDLGVSVVYDSIGKETFNKSINSLMNIGMLVLYGSSSGAVELIDIEKFMRKSLFFTRPYIFHYKSNHSELLHGAKAFFDRLMGKTIQIASPIEFKLTDASKAHKLIESRENLSSVILVP
jgi:NADPH2:quinone reductase